VTQLQRQGDAKVSVRGVSVRRVVFRQRHSGSGAASFESGGHRRESAARRKTAEELVEDKRGREKAFGDFMTGMVEGLSEENRKQGGDGNVFGAVIE
jgi:hypothetical protein